MTGESQTFQYGNSILLTARPDAGSDFTGWSGACTGTGPCLIYMYSQNVSIVAKFTAKNVPLLTVAKIGTGSGTIEATGINCGTDCTEVYGLNTLVTLTATPTP